MSQPAPAFTVSAAADLLRRSGLAARWPGWDLHPVVNHRLDPAARQQFIVRTEAPVAFLTVGPDLGGYHARVRLFTDCYPALAPALLGRGREQDRDLLLQQYVAGRPLLDAFAGEPEMAATALLAIDREFSARLQPSTTEAARRELDELTREWLAIPHWQEAEQEFFRNAVRPVLSRLIPPLPRRRVTNGDFLSRNILVTPAGQPFVIDHENAIETHFPAEDWLRFGWWDPLPAEVRRFVDGQVVDRPAWTVYFAIRQMVLEARHHRPRRFKLDAEGWKRVIADAFREIGAPGSGRLHWPETGTSPRRQVGVQLFWEDPLGWREAASQLLEVAPGRHRLTFTPPPEARVRALRLDPLDLPGHALVESVTVTCAPNGEMLFQAAGPGLHQLALAGDAKPDASPSPAGLSLTSTGNDPQLHLPAFPPPLRSALVVEVVLTVSLRDTGAARPEPAP